MEVTHQLPGIQRFSWVRNAAVRFGIITGIYAACLLVSWLLVANQVSALEPYAWIRNRIAETAMIVLLSMPLLRFRSEPAKMFLSGLTAWTLLTLTYLAAELHYTLLESRMGALHIFILGGISYGLVAIFQWVFLLCARSRQQYISQCRASPPAADRPRTH